MRRQTWLNLGLLVLAAAIAWLTLRPEAETSTEATPRLLELDRQSVHHVRIAVAGSIPIELERQAERWQMLSPYRVPADRARIDLLLDFLEARSLGSFPASAQDLHTYGLDHPGFGVDIDDHHFEFGAQHPFKPARYLKYNGTVHMVADLVTQHALAGPEAYVDTLLVPEGSQIARISVPGIEVEQREGRLHASVDGTNPDTIAQFIERWRAARATGVHAATGSEPSEGVVQIVDDRGTTTEYRIIGHDPAWRLRRADAPLVFELGQDAARDLFELPDARSP
jgi:hypothetical protein